MKRWQTRLIWALLVISQASIAVGFAAGAYTYRESEQRQHDLCALIAILNPTDAPPAPGRGTEISRGLAAYQGRDCKGR